jgi:pimeloyl-ACP methyl ester carboxylesterase
VLGFILTTLALWTTSAASYDYPVHDALLSTVIGTLIADEGPTPKKIPTRMRSLEQFPEREIPKVFWNQDEFRYSVAAQKTAAPLIFIVAGTGASYRSSKMLYLGRLFFDEGFHVISLSSPTHPNFILAASSSGHPGFTPEDSEDLYAVMKEAYSRLAARVEISEVHLTGYSLGGTQSAFLTAIDDREGMFHFKKILMINPSVDLFASVRILDGLFSYALPDGEESVIDLIDRLLAEVSTYSHENGRRSVDGELLYKIAKKRIAEGRPPTQKGLAGLIATAFRLSAANMFFTVDVLANSGFIVEKETELRVGTSLTPYFRRSMGWSFERYFDEILLPYWRSRMTDLDREALIEKASLRSLERMLKEDSRLAAVTNANDIILTPENLEFLRANMGDRLKIYPIGGHCGNLTFRENTDYMIRYFKEDAP